MRSISATQKTTIKYTRNTPSPHVSTEPSDSAPLHSPPQRVLDLQDVVQSKVSKLDRRLSEAASTGEAVDLHHALRAISVDVITDYGFGKSYDLLDHRDFGIPYSTSRRELAPVIWYFQQWPILQSLALDMPPRLATRLNTNLASFLKMQEECREDIVAIKVKMDAGMFDTSRTTIFHQLLNSKATEGHVVPSVDEFRDEAFTLLSAASDSTGNALTVAMYETVSNASIYSKLTAELNEAFPDPAATLDFLKLEKLPYLTGVVKEGLRLSFGAVGRLPRVVPEEGAIFNGLAIPASVSSAFPSFPVHI